MPGNVARFKKLEVMTMLDIENFIDDIVGCSELREVLERRCPYCGRPLVLEDYPISEGWEKDGSNTYVFKTSDLVSCSDFVGCGFEFWFTRSYVDSDCEDEDYLGSEVEEMRKRD